MRYSAQPDKGLLRSFLKFHRITESLMLGPLEIILSNPTTHATTHVCGYFVLPLRQDVNMNHGSI